MLDLLSQHRPELCKVAGRHGVFGRRNNGPKSAPAGLSPV
jgi:hypothetical protein